MDWKTFIVEITKALAWPGAIVIAAAIFRQPLRSLLKSLRSLKHGDTELVFSEGVEDARVLAQESGFDAKEIPKDNALLSLMDHHPKFAVIESFQRIEALLKKISATGNDPLTFNKPPRFYEQFLRDEERNVFRELRYLRNLAVHGGEKEISISDAYNYVELAQWLERGLRLRLASDDK